MSFDLFVEGPPLASRDIDRWVAEIERMGVSFEFHPEFDPAVDDGWIPVALAVDETSSFPMAQEVNFEHLRGIGKFFAGFEYYPDEDEVSFSSKVLTGGTVAAFLAGAALAALTRSTLSDPQSGEEATGSDGLAILRALQAASGELDIFGPDEPERFVSWERAKYEDDEAYNRAQQGKALEAAVAPLIADVEALKAWLLTQTVDVAVADFALREAHRQDSRAAVSAICDVCDAKVLAAAVDRAVYATGVAARIYNEFLLACGIAERIEPSAHMAILSRVADRDVRVLYERAFRGEF